MAVKKGSTGKPSGAGGHVLYDRLTAREARRLAAPCPTPEQEKTEQEKTEQAAPKKK